MDINENKVEKHSLTSRDELDECLKQLEGDEQLYSMRYIPKDIKSLKSNLFFISITSILCEMEVNHPVSRLPVANCYWHYYMIEPKEPRFYNVE